jgi:hypothetical protein
LIDLKYKRQQKPVDHYLRQRQRMIKLKHEHDQRPTTTSLNVSLASHAMHCTPLRLRGTDKPKVFGNDLRIVEICLTERCKQLQCLLLLGKDLFEKSAPRET